MKWKMFILKGGSRIMWVHLQVIIIVISLAQQKKIKSGISEKIDCICVLKYQNGLNFYEKMIFCQKKNKKKS